GGQPIRLALYLDVLVEGRTIPEPLLSSLPAARRAAANPETLTAIQKEIEAEFVQLLFSAEPDLRARVLRSLARATRGLNAAQLHFILDSEPQQKVKEWQPNARRLGEIEKELQDISRLSIVKSKPGERIGLQDEMYRIYAECMSANEADRQKEMISRQAAYRQMRAWADHQRQQLDEEDEAYVRDDLKRIHVERPSNILSTRMPTASAIEERRRNQASAALLEAELEYLHYTLLLDPNVHFNDIYYNMANERLSTYQEAEVAMFQAEMWRILHDNNTFRFLDLPERPRYGGGPESLPVILRRAAQTDDAAKWIMRFGLRKEYDRAIALANAIDSAVTQLTDTHEYHSWNHTLARAERTCWREYARQLRAEDIQHSIITLEQTAKELEALVQADIHTAVFPERNEYGFRGHPAEKRVVLVLSLVYYNLGYVRTTLGEFAEGIQSYANSLKYTRQLHAKQSKAHEANTRNNLARALAEMGKKRALRVCEDALELRIQVGEWLPIALSYNTMGLIMNDLYRPYEATQYCARALAIASKVGDERIIGLVLVQLGEALRRLVLFKIPPQDSPDEIYREAERALEQARDIFTSLQENVRLIEANLETGCLYRNWMLITDRAQLPRIWGRRYGDAVDYLLQAIQMAHERQLVRLELDARANLAWTHFYAQEWTAVTEALQAAQQLVPTEALLKPGQPPPRRDAVPSHFYKQLGKLYGLHGQMALKQFEAIVEKEKSRLYTAVDRAAFLKQKEEFLAKAADAYVQALGYAELFIPRSDSLVIMYDVLYDYLKRMNRQELQLFYRVEREASQKYNVRQIELENFGNLEGFLRDNFGDYYEQDTAVPSP
ncbi:MAG TPA: tetratricopeptide repeat protein, partial [Chloroflexota bacterium]|nr:tetratricopeptide repeat protein [Chloroflexota bacterium]